MLQNFGNVQDQIQILARICSKNCSESYLSTAELLRYRYHGRTGTGTAPEYRQNCRIRAADPNSRILREETIFCSRALCNASLSLLLTFNQHTDYNPRTRMGTAGLLAQEFRIDKRTISRSSYTHTFMRFSKTPRPFIAQVHRSIHRPRLKFASNYVRTHINHHLGVQGHVLGLVSICSSCMARTITRRSSFTSMRSHM